MRPHIYVLCSLIARRKAGRNCRHRRRRVSCGNYLLFLVGRLCPSRPRDVTWQGDEEHVREHMRITGHEDNAAHCGKNVDGRCLIICLICRFMVRTKRARKYSRRIGQNTGTLNMEKKLMHNAMHVAFVAAYQNLNSGTC